MALRIGLVVLLLVPTLLLAQSAPEALKGTERATFEEMKLFRVSVDDKNRDILKKHAKFIVSQLTDPRRDSSNQYAILVQELAKRDLPWCPDKDTKPLAAPEPQIKFTFEFGKVMCDELKVALKNNRPIVRINAARMLSVLAKAGYAPAADLALQVLEDKILGQPETQAVKAYALQTLGNAFAFITDPALPTLSAFMKTNGQPEDYRDLERRCIVFLCDYIMKPQDVTGKTPEEIGGVLWLRREAVRALGYVRYPRLIHRDQVLAKPAWVLLKVANHDGLTPPPDMKEIATAIVGFGRLFPVVNQPDRGLNADYASRALSAATYDLISRKMQAQSDEAMTVPWVLTANWMEETHGQFVKGVSEMQLNNHAQAKPAFDKAVEFMFSALKANNLTVNPPNTAAMREWLQANGPKSKSLYEGDATSVVIPAGVLGSP